MKHLARTVAPACLAVACSVALLSSSAYAGLLNLTQSTPDITSEFIAVSYTLPDDNGLFEALGTASHLDFDGTDPPDHAITDGSFHISITIGPSTGVPIGGTLAITGTVDVFTSGTLLTGTIDQFGFQDAGGDLFDFTFDVTGGDLAALYGAKAGVILDAQGSGFTGSFARAFDNGLGLGVSDTFPLEPVPEPCTLLLAFTALGVILPARRHWRRVKTA
jgi:hypothetical protein